MFIKKKFDKFNSKTRKKGAISIDGLFYQKDFAALSPTLFLIGNDKIR